MISSGPLPSLGSGGLVRTTGHFPSYLVLGCGVLVCWCVLLFLKLGDPSRRHAMMEWLREMRMSWEDLPGTAHTM